MLVLHSCLLALRCAHLETEGHNITKLLCKLNKATDNIYWLEKLCTLRHPDWLSVISSARGTGRISLRVRTSHTQKEKAVFWKEENRKLTRKEVTDLKDSMITSFRQEKKVIR